MRMLKFHLGVKLTRGLVISGVQMQRSEVKKARQELTGGMPTGEYRMQGLEAFTVWRKLPMDWTVQQLAEWPQDSLYFTSFEDFERWYDEQQA